MVTKHVVAGKKKGSVEKHCHQGTMGNQTGLKKMLCISVQNESITRI